MSQNKKWGMTMLSCFRDPKPGGGAADGKSSGVNNHTQGSSLQQLSFRTIKKNL